ncbi:MAG: hypothetical protein WCY62_04090 [Clostridia bacterium]|jgi:hypothetical protein
MKVFYVKYKRTFFLMILLAALIIDLIVINIVDGFEEFHILKTAVDDLIPFVELSLYTYSYWFLFFILSIVSLYSVKSVGYYKLILGCAVSLIICSVIFLCYPTTALRPEITSTGITKNLLTYLYSQSVHAGFPSRSISIATVSCFYMMIHVHPQGRQRSHFLSVFSLSSLIIIMLSALFVKQYYLFSVLAGFAVGAFSCLITAFIPIERKF